MHSWHNVRTAFSGYGRDLNLARSVCYMSDTNSLPKSLHNVRSLAFDLMGTCVDWHTSITRALDENAPKNVKKPLDHSRLALDWRAGFFSAILDSFQRQEQSPDIDIIHRTVLDRLLVEEHVDDWSDDIRDQLVRAWHVQSRM